MRLLGHRQTKGAATDKPTLPPPRHISTLPYSEVREGPHAVVGIGGGWVWDACSSRSTEMLVVKAISEQGERLYIREATLRQWREDFAAYLRELGVAANATPTHLRGRPKADSRDGIYRALKRGRSTFMRNKVERVAEDLLRGRVTPEPGKAKLLATRSSVIADWKAPAALLREQGHERLARDIESYVRQMPAVATDKERLVKGLLAQLATQRSRMPSAEREPSIGDRAR